MNKSKLLLGYIFGFIASLVLVILILLLILKFTIADKNHVLKMLKENNYYSDINDEIQEEMRFYLSSTGFTDEIINDVYDYDKLVSDINTFIDNIYLGKETKLDNKDIHSNIEKNIESYFQKSNLSSINKDGINDLITDLVNAYDDEVELYHFIDSLIPHVPKVINYINIGVIVCSMSLVVLLVVLIIVKYRYYSATIMASGLILLFVRLVIIEKIDVKNILIITEKFSNELRILLTKLQDILWVIAVIMIFLGLTISIVKCVKRKEMIAKKD